jgi:hypothetical protein
MPCHPARARGLLRKERAVVARQVPFTIRLKDRTLADSEVDGVQLRIDPGSKGTGLHLTDEKKEANDQGATVTVRRGLISVELQHRGNQISMCMQQRAGYRRRRRSANCRYRAPRYSNRTHPTGWLPPSLRHRVDTALSQATRMCRYAPVTDIHMENVSFDTHAMSAGRPLYGAEYTQGPLAGTTVRAFMKAGTRSYGFPRRCSSPRPPDAAPTHAPPRPVRIPASTAGSRQAALRIHHRGSCTRHHAVRQVGRDMDRTYLRTSQRPAQSHHKSRTDQRLALEPTTSTAGRGIRLHRPA